MIRKNISSIPILIGVNIIFFIIQLLGEFGDVFTNNLMLVPGDFFARPWMLLTSMFLHGSVIHLLFNMYVLFMFGTLLEGKLGRARFLFVYFLTGLAASLAYILFSSNPALGASGAIMGVLGVITVLMPDLRVLFFFAIPMSLRTAAIIIVIMEVIGFMPGIAHVAHLGGFFAGILYGLTLKKEKKTYQKKFSNKKHLDEKDIEEFLRSGRI